MNTPANHQQSGKRKVPSFKEIDGAIRALDVDSLVQESAMLPESLNARLQRVLRIYTAIQPLLFALGSTHLIPAAWRSALLVFNQALASIAEPGCSAPGAEFKAGKDL